MFLPNNYWGLVIKIENIRYEYQCDLSLEWWQICYVWYVSKVHQTGGDLIISNGIWYFCRVFLNLLYIIAMLLWPLNSHVLSYSMHLITKVPILNYVCSWNAGKRGQPKYLEKALCLYADDRQLEEWRIRERFIGDCRCRCGWWSMKRSIRELIFSYVLLCQT